MRAKTITFAITCAAVTVPGFAQQYVNPDNGHTYFLTPTPTTVFQARTFAQSSGGYLASVNDAQEHNWLITTFNVGSTPGTTDTLWIGYSDETAEGTWLWDSGETIAYTNWGPGEPNNGSGQTHINGEDYATLWWAHSGQWNDWPGDVYQPLGGGSQVPMHFYGIVELVPAPGSALVPAAVCIYSIRRRRGSSWKGYS